MHRGNYAFICARMTRNPFDYLRRLDTRNEPELTAAAPAGGDLGQDRATSTDHRYFVRYIRYERGIPAAYQRSAERGRQPAESPVGGCGTSTGDAGGTSDGGGGSSTGPPGGMSGGSSCGGTSAGLPGGISGWPLLTVVSLSHTGREDPATIVETSTGAGRDAIRVCTQSCSAGATNSGQVAALIERCP